MRLSSYSWQQAPAFLLALAALALLCGGCGPAHGGPGAAVAQRRLALEAELGRLGSSTDPATALRRSRLLRALGQQERALQELQAAGTQARERLDWRALSALWRERAAILLEQGQPEQALEAFGKRLESAVALEQDLERAHALVDSAYAFLLLGLVGQADEAVTEARVLGGEALLADPVTAERLALLDEQLKPGPEVGELFGRAAAGFRSSGAEADALRIEVHLAAQRARDTANASLLYRLDDAVQVAADPEPEALLRRAEAETELGMASYDACARHAAAAVRLGDERGLLDVGKIARVLAARCAERTGQLGAAVRYAEEAGDLVEVQLGHVTGEIGRQQLGFEAFLIYRLLFALQVAQASPGYVGRAFVTSERARARAHLDAVVRSRVGAMGASLPVPEALLRDRDAAEDRVRHLTQALVRSRAQRDVAKQQRDALWALQEAQEAVSRTNPLLALVAQPQPADLARVRQTLVDPETVLLSYFMSAERAFLFAVDAERESLLELGRPADEIDAAVRRYRQGFLLDPRSDLGQLKQQGQALYRDLVAPAQGALAGRRRVVIIPHGALAALPFESLVDEKGRFLVESHDVSYALSATLAGELVRRERPAGEKRKSFVGMGDPIYDWDAYSRGASEGAAPVATRGLELWSSAEENQPGAGRGLERLPGTAEELRRIAKLFGRDQSRYLRVQASEELVKKGVLAGYRMVHVASHGLMAPGYQALALTLRPGAAEDGFIMNSEIAELRLDADLVVLSACRTGSTRQRSAEPVAGLALSLRAAGARRVVLSLWSVDDEATAELMVRFYRPLTDPAADYAHSLSEAKRAMIASGPAHPYFWAPFVLLGG
ncbi:MAG: CHAT domain-containing protein [Deltaproteobacteria bacterium]|nr:CHAT domain-containing protein [Deltaproteobacteria bacterium]